VPEADLERELELAKIAAMYLQGLPSAQMALQLGQTPAQIDMSIVVLRRRWANTAIRDIDAAINEQLAKLDHLESQYWQAWERSQGIEMPLDEIRRLQRQYGITIRPAGDVTFLDGVMKCIDRRIKLMGLDAPMRVDITAKVRMMAEAAGLDPDAAVEEARRVIAEAKSEMAARIQRETDAEN